jgi:hypothetical protein
MQGNKDTELAGQSCSKCSRIFKTQGGLNGHQRAHSFWTALSKIPDQEQRKKEREDLNVKIVVAAIHHYTVNARPAKTLGAAPHCDVCAVVSEVDTLLIRDLSMWLVDKENK